MHTPLIQHHSCSVALVHDLAGLHGTPLCPRSCSLGPCGHVHTIASSLARAHDRGLPCNAHDRGLPCKCTRSQPTHQSPMSVLRCRYARAPPICNTPKDIEAFRIYQEADELSAQGRDMEASVQSSRALERHCTSGARLGAWHGGQCRQRRLASCLPISVCPLTWQTSVQCLVWCRPLETPRALLLVELQGTCRVALDWTRFRRTHTCDVKTSILAG